MDWFPKSMEQFRLLVAAHEFCAGFLACLVFVYLMRRYLFISSERVLQQHIIDLKNQCSKYEKSLKVENARLAKCHKEIEALRKPSKEV